MAKEKKKLKLKIVKVVPEKNPDGVELLKFSLKTPKATYVRGVALADWENPQSRRSTKEDWLKTIGAIESRDRLSEDELEAKAEQYKGEEIEEDE